MESHRLWETNASLYSHFSDALRNAPATRLRSSNSTASMRLLQSSHIPMLAPLGIGIDPPRLLTLKPSSNFVSPFTNTARRRPIQVPSARTASYPRLNPELARSLTASSTLHFDPKPELVPPRDQGAGLLVSGSMRESRACTGRHAHPVHGAQLTPSTPV